jgi:Flp pilus assembly protein TadD
MDASPSAETDASAGADAASSASLDASADAAVVLASQDGGQVADADVVVDAKALKKAAQRALDNGKLAVAIENGEASVAADPTDGEAWLLLGAAYEQKGRVADARAAYQSCVSKGKRGPTGECAALLR